MCKAFSCIVTRGNKVCWKLGKDSHQDILEFFAKRDANLVDDKLPPLNTFARIEINPPDMNYLNTDFSKWLYVIDEKEKPIFLVDKHEVLCREALEKWAEKVYTFNVEEAKKPIHPFKIKPPKKITRKYISLVKKWDSVGASVGASVWASVWDSVRASVGASVWASVGDSVWDSVGDSVWDSVWDSVRDSVGDSVRGSVWASVGDSVGDSVWASIWASIWAYIGSLFSIKTWKHINYENPLFKRGEYPFQSLVDLWKAGLVPSFDGKVWRLHGGKKGEVLWEGTFRNNKK